MSFVTTLSLLLAGWICVWLATAFIIPFVGIVGTLIAGHEPYRTKVRLNIGAIVAGLCQSYVYLCFAVAFGFLIRTTDTHIILNVILTAIAFLAVIVPLWMAIGRGKVAYNEGAYKTGNDVLAMLWGLQYCLLICIIGFFIILFIPGASHPLWTWVINIVN